jgi:hypothetical protein
MDGPVLASRVANALVEDAHLDLSPEVTGALDAVGLAPPPGVEAVLDRFRDHFGGMWVGGRVTLTPTTYRFRPNAINRTVQSGTLEFEVPTEAISDVELQPGFATRIVAVRVGDKVVRVRCYGAARLAAAIRAAVAEARGTA